LNIASNAFMVYSFWFIRKYLEKQLQTSVSRKDFGELSRVAAKHAKNDSGIIFSKADRTGWEYFSETLTSS